MKKRDRREFLVLAAGSLAAASASPTWAAEEASTRPRPTPENKLTQPTTIVFDVNETLLDLRALRPRFETAFGDGNVLHEWFGQVLQSALLGVVIGPYADFGRVGRSALEMVAGRRGVTLSADGKTEILKGMLELPPHPDVRPALAQLKNAGFRLATLTNSTAKSAQAQLGNAGIAAYFEKILSVDDVRSLKPARQVYEYAAASLGVSTPAIRLVAAHSWDVAGAMRAGCKAAFVARLGMVIDPLWDSPDIVGRDLGEVAHAIIESRA